MTKPVWTGLITVRALPGNRELEGREAALVWVVVPATSGSEYLEAARTALEERGFEALEADHFQPAAEADLSEELRSLVDHVEATQVTAIASTFYVFPDDAAGG